MILTVISVSPLFELYSLNIVSIRCWLKQNVSCDAHFLTDSWMGIAKYLPMHKLDQMIALL
jgi:hypothetical protein